MNVARAYQIPHSVFLTWCKDDRDKAIWQYVRDKQTCRSCGTRAEEWHESKGGRRDAYEAHTSICPGCEQVATLQANLPKDGLARGTYIRLSPTARR